MSGGNLFCCPKVADIEDIAMKSSSSECPLSAQGAGCCCEQSSIASSPEVLAIDTKPSVDFASAALSTSHVDHMDDDAEAGHHNVRSLILIMALSLHHLFEGMSLGLQQTVNHVLLLLMAVMCHETIVSFSLGLQFIKCKYSLKRFIITCIAVATIMPIGVAIGQCLCMHFLRTNSFDENICVK